MTRLLTALGVLIVATAMPMAAAGPLDAVVTTLEDVEPAPPANDGMDLARDAMDMAVPQESNPLPAVNVPVDGGATWLGPLAIAGLGALAAGISGFFLYGGARFVTPAEVLQNDVRKRIFAYLKGGVGANLKQVTDDLGLTTTNAIWHLRKLEDAGLVNSRRFNGYKVFYPAEGGIEARRMSLSVTALTNANAQEVFEYVMSHPGSHQREIARALEVNHGTVRWHLKKLMTAELITEERRGKTSSYVPTQTGLAALRHVVKAATGTAAQSRPAVAASSS